MEIAVWRNADIESLRPIDYNSSHAIIKSEIFGATKFRKCLTCNQVYGVCQGHWGRIELSEPVVRPSFSNMLNTLLSRLCLHCGVKVPISVEDELILSRHYPFSPIQLKEYIEVVTRLRKISDLATKCRRCGAAPHKIKLSNGVFTSEGDKGDVAVSHKTIYRLLNSIPLHHYPVFTSIKFTLTDLFFTSYPIAPLYLRAGVEFDGLVIESEITKRYQDLLGKISSFNTPAIQRCVDDLELNDSLMPNSSFARPFLGKYTLFRSLITSYSGGNTIRNVLNVNKSYSPDDGYFCKQFYTTITLQIQYNDYTKHLIEGLKDKILYVKNGDRYIRLKGPVLLAAGDYIEILAIDAIKVGYYPNMISYRQPSLHRPSIVAQIIKYTPYNSANGNSSTLSTLALPGMNGDQDGDEFNSRLVTSIPAQYEHMMIMRPRANLINDSTSSLTYGLIQLEVLQFIKLLKRYDRRIYQHLLPDCLRDARFETISGDEISASKKSRNLIKNVHQLTTPLNAWRLFTGIAKVVKNTLGREKMAFMIKEIIEGRKLIKDVDDKKNIDLEILQSDISKMYKEGRVVDSKFIATRLATMNSAYEKDIKKWLESGDILTNDFSLISYANLKVNPRMLMELLIMQKSEMLADPTNYYLNRVNAIYPTNSLDLNAFGVITGAYFNGLSWKDLMHTFAPARKKLIITTVMTAIPGMISRNMTKTMEDMCIDYFKFSTIYKQIIDTHHNLYKLPTSQLFLIPSKVRKQTLFPLDLPFILANFHTLLPTKEAPLAIAEQHKMIYTFSEHITTQYMYSFGCVHFYIREVLGELEPLPKSRLEYIFNLIELKYKIYPAVGEPVGIHTSTTIGEVLTQSSLANFHTVKKSGDEISLDADSNNINLIQFSRTVKDRVVTVQCEDISRLKYMKQQIQLVYLEDLGYELISHTRNTPTSGVIIIRLARRKLEDREITISDLEDIIANDMNNVNYIEQVTVEIYRMQYHIGVKLLYSISDASFINQLIIQLRVISKGTHNCTLTGDTLLIELQSLDIFANFDTTEMVISVPPELSVVSPMMSLQGLYNNYSASGMLWLPYRTLSLFQTRYGFPIGIKKYQTIGQPTISKMSHQRGYHDMQKAAASREYQQDSVAGSTLQHKPNRIGTGYFDVYHSVAPYLFKAEDDDGSKVTELML